MYMLNVHRYHLCSGYLELCENEYEQTIVDVMNCWSLRILQCIVQVAHVKVFLKIFFLKK